MSSFTESHIHKIGILSMCQKQKLAPGRIRWGAKDVRWAPRPGGVLKVSEIAPLS